MLADLRQLEAAGRLRLVREITTAQGPEVEVDGRKVLLCCSNDYLGLAGDPRLKAAAIAAVEQWGTGSGASRLISGSMTPHHELERAVADWKRTEAALVFNSGYHANVGTIPALVGRGDLIYSDALNHASLIDGARLSRATVRVYRHLDVTHLESLLEKDKGRSGRRLIVTDSVFSMDADEAPLQAICDLADRYGAWVMVDEAHASGVLGPEGAGLVRELGLGERVQVQMGTFGKALGSFGAYVAGAQALIDTLINRARSFVFTTALPPAVVAASQAAIELVRSDDSLRAGLLERVAMLRAALSERGWRVLPGRAPIIPIVIGDDRETMAFADMLYREGGILAVGIRPPTVPEGTSRIRLTITAAHDESHLARIIQALS
ncbi:MAG: 8-amino-7-oxononanoate synthase [Candidatus Dadabacteria bacterium]|nr:MAG: 8-amino-7-oxononanoate synthase [Candidatus Dadabacteria bacterium]